MKTNIRSSKPVQQSARPVVLTPAEVAAVAGGEATSWVRVQSF